MKDYEVLEAAAEYIEINGWHQGSTYGPRLSPDLDESVCAWGAISKVGGESFSLFRALDLFRDITGEGTVGNWNGTPGRTKQEVLDSLQKAAKLGRIREDCADAESLEGII